MAGLSGLIIVWQNLHPLLWEMECPGEGELVTRLLQADCHLPLQERILGGYFSRGYGGMPNATKSMASAVCICNSGLDCLWAGLLYAMCSSDVCLPGMLQFTRYSMVMIIAFVFCEFFFLSLDSKYTSCSI